MTSKFQSVVNNIMVSVRKLIIAGACLLGVTGFKIEQGILSVDSVSEKFTCCDPIKNSVTITKEAPINIQFVVLDKESKKPYKPTQSVVEIGSGGLAQAFIAPVDSKGNAKLTIPFAKLSPSVLVNGTADISVIVSDVNIASPEIKKIASVSIDETLLAQILKGYSKPVRFTTNDEIHHIFKQPAKQANPAVALFFVLAIAGLLVVFVASLLFNNLLNFSQFSTAQDSSLDLVYKVTFSGSIILLEVFFFKYYLGDSIFNLIIKTAFLTGPSVWFGTRVLRKLQVPVAK